MKIEKSKFGFAFLGLAGVVILAMLVCGCTSTEEGGVSPTQTTGAIESLTVTGSTTVLPIGEKAAEAFMESNPTADIQVSGGGSSVGVQAVGEGTADIGMASRELKSSEEEKYPELVQFVIAMDGIAVIVHPDNPVSQLTFEQVREIYAGNITNWNEVGGNDAEIVVVGRDSASGTRTSFEDMIMEKMECVPTMLEKNSNGAVQATISGTPGAIGYVGLGYVDETVKGVKIAEDSGGEYIAPTVANVKSGVYPISRSLNMFTNGEPTGLAKQFIDFIQSTDGQKIVEEEDFVPI